VRYFYCQILSVLFTNVFTRPTRSNQGAFRDSRPADRPSGCSTLLVTGMSRLSFRPPRCPVSGQKAINSPPLQFNRFWPAVRRCCNATRAGVFLPSVRRGWLAAAANRELRERIRGAIPPRKQIGNVPNILYAEVRDWGRGVPLATLGQSRRALSRSAMRIFDGQANRVLRLANQSNVLVSAGSIVHGGIPARQLILIGGTEGLWGVGGASLARFRSGFGAG